MRKQSFYWMTVSVLCFVGAYYFWHWGQRAKEAKGNKAAATAASGQLQQPLHSVASIHRGSVAPEGMAPKPGEGTNGVGALKGWLKYRLRNTTESVDALARNPRGVLLENALIDTGKGLDWQMPASLRSAGAPGAYIVQAQGAIDGAFRAALARAGAQIVSYIPNNAFLVRASASAAQELAGQPTTASVLPYEPYYKLQGPLLAAAVEQTPLPGDNPLKVVVFAGAQSATRQALEKLGAQVLDESPSPFGPVLTVQAQPSLSLAAVAQLAGVEGVELGSERKPANDLSRATVAVAADSVAPTNYLGLTGANVLVQVNDTGVDATHPGLAGRVLGTALTDVNGHGTHVAGIIAGDGSQSQTVTNAPGSVMPPGTNQFRGMAPGAKIYSLPEGMSDFALQEAAARTNALISNNSWNYSGGDYDIEAASYDAAVRDALPETTGSQPVLFVFSAGDSGGGNDNGLSGQPESIQSPGTAKNVITVGALEQARGITNEVVVQGQTNTPWLGETDSGNEVAGFSSRGNVGIGIEGDNGRFKPDVVAPGVFVVSAQSGQWDQQAYYNPTNYHDHTFSQQLVAPGELHPYSIFVPDNAVALVLRAQAVDPVVDLPLYVKEGDLPGVGNFVANNTVSLPGNLPLTTGTTWFYSVGNPTNVTVEYNVSTELVTTNDNGNYFQVLSNMNVGLGPYYRYESGTSMAAADVSGMLALMEEFFGRQQVTPSPALLKALLINGARSANSIYNFQVQNSINYQGWGLVNLTNSIPEALTNGVANQGNGAPLLWFDQSPAQALATGERHTIFVKVNGDATGQPLRATLVWTDPPGNPAAAFKLVNNLDLVVTNLDTGEVYFGNDIGPGANFNAPWDTNQPPNRDVANNVENVFLGAPVGTNYSVTVIGRAVNVNAVTASPDQVAQDYALVVSSGDGSVADALTLSQPPVTTSANAPVVTGFTNQFGFNPGISGELLLHQRAGASTPLLGTNTIALGANTGWGTNGVITEGITNQWHFYTLTNTTTFTNAAFATFLPPDLSVPPMGVTNVDNPANATRVEGDIDLYVSTDPGLLSLDPNALAAADKSLGRGGTEVIVYSNAVQSQTYYVGVKSEDQEAVEYAFFGVFSQLPFAQSDSNGVVLRGINVPAVIPDGSPAKPGSAVVVSIDPTPMGVRRVIVTNIITHQNFGDLLGNLNHNGKYVVLNNHTFGGEPVGADPNTREFVYEDNGEKDLVPYYVQHSDGPGSLRDYVGEPGQGVWLMTEVDNALTHTGQVDSVFIRLQPQGDTNGVELTVQPNSFVYDAIDVPADATNLTIEVENESTPPLPLELYVRRGDFPTRTTYDYFKEINPPGGTLTITTSDLPPLRPGRYYVGIYNPNGVAQRILLVMTVGLNPNGVVPVDFTSAGPMQIADDAVSYSTIDVTDQQQIVSVNVGVAIQHPRISDLVLTLINPTGQRYLLMENRGGTSANAGSLSGVTNVVATVWQDGFENGPYGNQPAGSGDFNGGWYLESGDVDVYHAGIIAGSADTGLQFLDLNGLGPGTIYTNLQMIPGQQYRLSFAFAPNPGAIAVGTVPRANINLNGVTLMTLAPSYTNTWPELDWQHTSVVFTATSTLNKFQLQSLVAGAGGVLFDSFRLDQLEIEPSYLTFTEDTNLTQVPIKFAQPPFVSTDTVTNFSISDFESAAAGDYTTGQTFEGWTVVSNQVSVVNDPANAQAGNQFLALANGTISRTLPTLHGDQYVLSYAYRGPGIVSWWRGESNFLDSAATNNGGPIGNVTFVPGVVGHAFKFNGTDYISVPNNASLNLTNGLTLEMWYRNDSFSYPNYGLIAKRSPGDDPCNYGMNILVNPHGLGVYYNDTAYNPPGNGSDDAGVGSPYETSRYSAVPVDHVFHHLGGVFQQADPTHVRVTTYVDGQLVRQITMQGNLADTLNSSNVLIGTSHPMLAEFMNGALDEVSIYRRALSASEILAIYSATNSGKFDPTTNAPQNLAKASVTVDGLGSDIFYGDNTNWQFRTVSFRATQNGTPLQVTGLEPGMLLDSFTLTQLPGGLYYFPEESLKPLTGQSAQGTWTLEVRDARVGATPPTAAISSWQLQFVFQTNTPTPVSLVNATPATNNIPPCTMAYYIVDVPAWATFATNILVSASSPVQVWFNQNTPPGFDGTNAGDVALIPTTPNTYANNGAYTLCATNGTPLLLPGQRYYLGVENPCSATTNAQVVLRVDYDTPLITLTNAIAYDATNSGSFGTNDSYRFVVTNTAVRAQFEINNPSGAMALVARQGWPPPTLGNYDYISTNAGTNDQLIVVFTNSAPVALSAGDWYLTAVNLSGGPVSYSIKATEWAATGQPITITNVQMEGAGTNQSFCITWTSLIGVHYYVEGVPELTNTNWDVISPTITAVDVTTTYCVPLPSPYHYFRVVEGLAPTSQMGAPALLSASEGAGGFLLQWAGPVSARYQVQWTPGLAPPAWATFTNIVTSATGQFQFLDDGSQSGGLGPLRFYRVFQVP